MGFRVPGIERASFTSTQKVAKSVDVPKGYLAIYLGDKMKRFLIPTSYLSQPLFQELLSQVEEEFGYDHPMEEPQQTHALDTVMPCILEILQRGCFLRYHFKVE